MDVIGTRTRHVFCRSAGERRLRRSEHPYRARRLPRHPRDARGTRSADDSAGSRVLVQGTGSVGGKLARLLLDAGAIVLVSDVDEERARARRRSCPRTGARARVRRLRTVRPRRHVERRLDPAPALPDRRWRSEQPACDARGRRAPARRRDPLRARLRHQRRRALHDRARAARLGRRAAGPRVAGIGETLAGIYRRPTPSGSRRTRPPSGWRPSGSEPPALWEFRRPSASIEAPMARWLRLLVLLAAAAWIGAAGGRRAPAALVIPYLSGGAGVYLDDDGRPVTSEGAPATAGIHPARAAGRSRADACRRRPRRPSSPCSRSRRPRARSRFPRRRRAATTAQLVTAGRPSRTSPRCSAAPTPPGRRTPPRQRDRLLDLGRHRDHDANLALRGDRAGEDRHRGLRAGLFVLAHEAAHAAGYANECDADKIGVATMGGITARLGWGAAVGEAAARQVNEILRPNRRRTRSIGRLPQPGSVSRYTSVRRGCR